MRVSRAQAEENRQTVIDVASRLFRRHGFDGIGLKDLMAGAGLTQGAFYKQFESKDDLVAQASRRALEDALDHWSAAAASRPDNPLSAVVDFYLSEGHCAERSDGCPVVALGSDAARHGPHVKESFQAGIQEYLDLLDSWIGGPEDGQPHSRSMAILSTMVGAVLLARAVNNEQMSAQFLEAAAKSVMAQAAATAAKADPRQ
ncbi:TetR/AcrR family transcriptional regulator [Chelatococcus asaccharovorans]|uniref:TetR family transcriptional regulator n=1 Tax=Chelatococcus asaccharovorans TaxID=28210 RepID=A0A2V3U6A5_9HYPH|nr:TetR/AcrR family transcriptional regulator [Chelatococcus asaccharovorans]MBS7705683.1 TetR/AcrR family transcriptional regulator [Chelatococcus asaccharovorans]PXW58702.1 TetR family transcriptional regulator [Chelatococcus asaccharovorans]